jgi:hypothetical protein
MVTLERATEGYDEEHEQELVDVVIRALLSASKVSDVNAVVFRTGEAASALVTALSLVLALSPDVMRSPATIRNTAEAVRKRLLRRVSEAASSEDVRDFKKRCFNTSDEGGHA